MELNMKKLISSVIISAGFMLRAALPLVSDADNTGGWLNGWQFTPLQIGLGYFDRSQIFDGKTNCLTAIGIISLCQKSAVISSAPVNALQNNFFLQGATFVNLGKNNYFIAAAPVNFTYENFGLQAGVFNVSFNSAGAQTGVMNFGGFLQIGILNSASRLQIGLFNQEGSIQIGLLNYNPDALIPWMPFFNIGFREAEDKI
jgi:hypothetical protein